MGTPRESIHWNQFLWKSQLCGFGLQLLLAALLRVGASPAPRTPSAKCFIGKKSLVPLWDRGRSPTNVGCGCGVEFGFWERVQPHRNKSPKPWQGSLWPLPAAFCSLPSVRGRFEASLGCRVLLPHPAKLLGGCCEQLVLENWGWKKPRRAVLCWSHMEKGAWVVFVPNKNFSFFHLTFHLSFLYIFHSLPPNLIFRKIPFLAVFTHSSFPPLLLQHLGKF